MHLRAIFSFILVFVFLTAKADQHAVVRLDVAKKTVEYLKTQDKIILFCGCCTGDEMQKIIISEVAYEREDPKAASRFYRVRIHGLNEVTDQGVNKTIDLAYAWINDNGVAKNLAWHMDLSADPCHPAFDWATYKVVKEKAKPASKSDKETFEKSFLKVKKHLENGVGFKAETFETGVEFIVDKVEVKTDYHSKSVVISHFGSIYEQRYTIPLQKVKGVELTAGTLKIMTFKDGKITKEEFKDTELKYRIFPWGVDIAIWEPDIQVVTNFTKMTQTCNSMPKKMAKPVVTERKEVEVDNLIDFFNSIKPNTHIKIKPGSYLIEDLDTLPETDYVTWQMRSDGKEPHIEGVQNMTISCSDTAHILIKPRYAWVMKFSDCKYISLKNIVFGHTVGGSCTGGCLSFDRSSDISIEGCSLYGSGTEGLRLEYVSKLMFSNSLIYECTYDLLNVRNCSHLTFAGSTFKDTHGYELIELKNCANVSYISCEFTNNSSRSKFMPHLFKVDPLSENISLQDCKFQNNKVYKFASDQSLLDISKSSFLNNDFGDCDDGTLNEKYKD